MQPASKSTLPQASEKAEALFKVLEVVTPLRPADYLETIHDLIEMTVGRFKAGNEKSMEATRIKLLKEMAYARGDLEVDPLEAEGGTAAAKELADRLSVSRNSINEWRRSGKIFGTPWGRGNFKYPVFQIHEGSLLSGLSETLAELAKNKLSEQQTALFFLTPDENESGTLVTPLKLLREGKTDIVLKMAERHGEQGA